MKSIILIFFALLCASVDAQNIRLSFKVILDPDTGNRPLYASETYFNNAMDFMNEVMCNSGRGISFSREPTIEIGGINDPISNTYFAVNPLDTIHWEDILELEAENDPGAFGWRENRINIYFNNGGSGGRCSFPTDEIILIGAVSISNNGSLLLHEIGHFFNLCHTQGCPCGGCTGNNHVDCNSLPQDDGVSDTLEDRACWDKNDISNNAFGLNYAQLDPSQQLQVDNTFHNIMSYHYSKDRLTEGQLDRWVQSIFNHTNRQDVVSTTPIYADDQSGCVGGGPFGLPCSICTASPLSPVKGIDCAIDILEQGNRDIIVLKPGNYDITNNRIIGTNGIITGTSNGDAIIK